MICPLGGFDCVEPAKAHSDNDTNIFGLMMIDLYPAILHRHTSGRDAVLNEEIHFLDLFRFDEVFGTKIRNLPSDARCKSIKIREPIDLPNTRLSGDERLPIFFQADSQWCNEPQARHNNSALFRCCQSPCPIGRLIDKTV